MVSLASVGMCFSASMYSMEEGNKTDAEKTLFKAKKTYDKGQGILSAMERSLVFSCNLDRETSIMHETTEKSRANTYFCKSRLYVTCILNDKKADEVTKKSALDIEKKIDAIPWASK